MWVSKTKCPENVVTMAVKNSQFTQKNLVINPSFALSTGKCMSAQSMLYPSDANMEVATNFQVAQKKLDKKRNFARSMGFFTDTQLMLCPSDANILTVIKRRDMRKI
jgi:hypothetical protein